MAPLRGAWTTAAVLLLSAMGALAADEGPVVREPVRYGTSAPLLTRLPRTEAPRMILPSGGFAGLSNVNGVLPPDTVGDIGPAHYVQAVNLSFAVFDRSGTLLYGPADLSTLWAGLGGACETSFDGDPKVLYDHLADRWVVTGFALPNFPVGPYYQCLAVSQTADPTGAWHRYQWAVPSEKMNDMPAVTVWPDGYYVAFNQFSCDFLCQYFGLSWGGQGVAVLERSEVLVGGPARMVYFDLYSINSSYGGMQPADLDGPPPPAGTPGYFVEWDDSSWIGPSDALRIFELRVDWDDPSQSQFNGSAPQVVDTANADPDLCGFSRNCIPQPGGTDVDALSDRIMWAVRYRRFGAGAHLVLNHTVDVGGDHAGVRWYELENDGRGWYIVQQGTHAPDADHRWMGSIAMNGARDIALGYSLSSTVTFPSVAVAGRLAGDPMGQLSQGEAILQEGSGYQAHASGRWGDYSSMSVDPVDDCTFWYTQEYYETASSADWRTWVGWFRLSDCADICTLDEDCDDGNLCNGTEICTFGTCEAGIPLFCDDQDACTLDGCDPAGGCKHEPIPTPGEVTGLRLRPEVGLPAIFTSLRWNPVTYAEHYNVYRSRATDLSDLSCLEGGIPVNSTLDDGGSPQVGQVYLHLVSAWNCGGEGSLGLGSDDLPRADPPPACP